MRKYYTIQINGIIEYIFVEFRKVMLAYERLSKEMPGVDIIWTVEWD